MFRSFLFGIAVAEVTQESGSTSITTAFIGAFSVMIGLIVWTIREDRQSLKDMAKSLIVDQAMQKIRDDRLEQVMVHLHVVADCVKEMGKVQLAIHDDYQSLAGKR